MSGQHDNGEVRSDCKHLFCQIKARDMRHGLIRNHQVEFFRDCPEDIQGVTAVGEAHDLTTNLFEDAFPQDDIQLCIVEQQYLGADFGQDVLPARFLLLFPWW